MGGWKQRDLVASERHDRGSCSVYSIHPDSSGSDSIGSSPSDHGDREAQTGQKILGAAQSLQLDKEWHSFASQWHEPRLRIRVAQQMPFIVSLIWHDEFVALSDEHCRPPQHASLSVSTSDQEALRLTKRFVDSILSRTRISAVAFLLALFFIYRYRSLPEGARGNPGSQYRMFVVGLLLAQKYTEDHPFSNRVWAQLAQMPAQHINVMEREFLANIDHRLSVELQDFQWWVVTLDGKFRWTTSLMSRTGLVPVNTLPHPKDAEYRQMPLPPTPIAVGRRDALRLVHEGELGKWSRKLPLLVRRKSCGDESFSL